MMSREARSQAEGAEAPSRGPSSRPPPVPPVRSGFPGPLFRSVQRLMRALHR
jgi:hypothetical protein